MRYSGKGLVLFLIFPTLVVGQEAGDKARGELRPSSIHFELFPTSTVEGVLTSGLQLETEDGTIIAKDDLINPEYFVVGQVKTVLSAIVGTFTLAYLIQWCLGSSDGHQHDGGWGVPSLCTGEPNTPLSAVLGLGIGIPIGIGMGKDPEFASGKWKPW